jgi:lipoprotein-releasing system permease protein
MNYVAWMIAWRYLTRSAYESTLSTMVLISFCGIFIGSCSLALVTAIMHGFDIETQRKLQSVHAQATIRARNEQLDIDALKSVFQKEFPMITAFAPTSEAHGLFQEDGDEVLEPTVILIKAIDTKHEPYVSTLTHNLIPKKSITQLTDDTIIIGSTLAQERNIKLGDVVNVFYAEENQPKRHRVSFKTYSTRVVGFIKTGIDEFDSSMALCSFDFFNTLFPTKGIQEVRIRFAENICIDGVISDLKKRLLLDIYSWQELYPALVSALILEKYVSFVVLALITLVASMNIIALTFMKITTKRMDIALLKALGISNTSITSIFLIFSISIALIAALCGLLCAIGLSWIIEHYQCIRLPDVYYVTHLPAHMTWSIPMSILLLVCIVSFFAAWIPARKTRTLSIAQTLRFEE